MTNYLIITGGSRGIGKATISYYLQHGWSAINIARTPCDLPDVINVCMDLKQPQAIEKNASILIEALDHPNKISLVHNAAQYTRDSVPTLALNDLRQELEVNVLSAVALNKIVIPHMQPNSSIIYIGSTLAEKAVPGSASYIVSKHAVIGLMRATCQDLAAKNITTCCVCPGLVDTKLLKDCIAENDIDWLLNNKVIGKRLIEPMEIAKLVYFYATNPIINGSVIHANLGQLS